MKTIHAKELKKKLDDKEKIVVINVLPKEYFDKEHIPGSINVPADEIETTIMQKVPDLDTEVIVYCSNTECQASPRAARKLSALGYTNVRDFEEGMQGWKDAGY